MGSSQRVRPASGIYSTHAVFTDAGLALTICLGEVPAHSPYQPGDWVRYHGYSGSLPGPQQWGWRGYVLGGMGSTLLRGVTDDGREWCEHWGGLLPDRQPLPDSDHCVCCPRPARRPPKPVQLSMFELLTDARRGGER